MQIFNQIKWIFTFKSFSYFLITIIQNFNALISIVQEQKQKSSVPEFPAASAYRC